MRNALSVARSCEVALLLLLALIAVLPVPVPAGKEWAQPSAPPSILSTVPAAGELNVSLTTSIEVRFSEPMNASTLVYAIQPTLAVLESWPQPDTLRLSPTVGLTVCTAYDVQVGARDADEGILLVQGLVPNPWSFLSACDRPVIVATEPADGATNVPVGRDLVLTFSEPMDSLSVRLLLNPTPSSMVTAWSGNGTVLTGRTVLNVNTTYTATVSGRDRQGNDLIPGLVPNPWSFTVNEPPRVSAPSLSATGCLDGGSTVTIAWSMGDDTDRPEDLIVTLSYWNGTATERIVGPVTGFPSSAGQGWTLPTVDLTTNVSLVVEDSAGAVSRNWSEEFRIDTWRPAVLSTSPRDGQVDVLFTGDITIVFSEPMDRGSVEAAMTSVPPLAGAQFEWLNGDAAIRIDPGGMMDRQPYVVTIGQSARDRCGAGRSMGADFTFTFTTGRAPSSQPGRLVVVDRQETSVTLSWDPVTIFVTSRPIPPGADIEYIVIRGDDETDPGQLVAVTRSTRHTDAGLRPDRPYVYWVVAVVDGEASAPSAPETVRTLPPFFTTANGRFVLSILFALTVAGVVLWGNLRRRRERVASAAAIDREVGEIIELIGKARVEHEPVRRQAYEHELQSRFLGLVQGPEDKGGRLDPHLEGLYRALARALLQSPEVNLAHGRKLADVRLGSLARLLGEQGASYRLLSEAEASVSSDLFRGLPESGRKALLLVYFYSLEEYLSHRLRVLVPPGATVLLGDRGHINVRRRGWEQQWAGLSLGNLLYLLDHNRAMFLADPDRWEEDVEPFVHQTVDARNRTAHPSREAPPLDRVRELIYTSFRLLESVLKAPKGVAA